MTGKPGHQLALELVGGYHQDQLSVLLARAGEVLDGFRAGELDAFDADAELFQYSRAAKALWSFCNVGDVRDAAAVITEGPAIDWWARGAFRRR